MCEYETVCEGYGSNKVCDIVRMQTPVCFKPLMEKSDGGAKVACSDLVMRYRGIVEKNSQKYDGKEQEYTFHGGHTSGYDAGKLAAYENMADILGIDIPA